MNELRHVQTRILAEIEQKLAEVRVPQHETHVVFRIRMYVAELYSRRVSIFSETGAFMDTLSHKDMRVPHGIAIHRDNLYVMDRDANAVFKFKLEADIRFVAKFGNPTFGAQRLNSPLGLSVSAMGDVFVADSNNHRIQVLDNSLRIQRRITHETMIEPCDIKLTPDEVYVLCAVSPCILVFSHAG